jgi:3-oxoacyl-[acyl-carrier-protein] synthase-3
MAAKRADGPGPGRLTHDIGLVISGASSTTPEKSVAELRSMPCFDVTQPTRPSGCGRPAQSDVLAEGDHRAIDFGDRSSAVCSAMRARRRLLDGSQARWPSRYEFRTDALPGDSIPFASHFRQDGHAIQGFAIRRMTESLQGLKAAVGGARRFRFIGHQANLGALTTVCERAGIAEDDHWHNVSDFGNTGSAGASSVLSDRRICRGWAQTFW